MLLEPWFTNRTKALVKRPKLYVRDPGLARWTWRVHACAILLATDRYPPFSLEP